MKLEIDATVHALYLRLAPGRVADTLELADLIVADVDEAGTPLGIEFVRAEDFAPFLQRRPDLVVLPSRLTYVSLDRGKAWQVETGAGEGGSPHEGDDAPARLHGEFVRTLLANPGLLDRIPPDATLILIRPGATELPATKAVGFAERIAEDGGLAVLQPIGVPIAS